MPKVTEVLIRCLNCGEWFNSPISFSELQPFDTATLYGNKAQCQQCGKMTDCNKENIKMRFEDGGFVGDET